MCNAMDIKKAVAGDGNVSMTVKTDLKDNGTKDTVDLGRRSSQPLKDFFVPLSQREKLSKKLGDEVDKPDPAPPASVEDVVKKKRGRQRKNSLEDDTKEVIVPLSAKEKPKKTASLEAILNPATVAVAENGAIKGERPRVKVTEDSGSDFFVPVSKRERLTKELVRDEATTFEETSIVAEEGVKKRGRRRKSSLEFEDSALKGSPSGEVDGMSKPKKGGSRNVLLDDGGTIALPGVSLGSCKRKQGRPRRKSIREEGELEDIAKHSGSLQDGGISPRQLFHESQSCVGEVPVQQVVNLEIISEKQAAGTSLMQNSGEKQGEKAQDKEGKDVVLGAGSGDHQLSQAAPCDDFFIPVSKRRKRKEELIDKKRDKTGNVPSEPKLQRDGQTDKPSVEGEGVHPVPMLHTVLGKEKRSVPTGLPPKEAASSIPGTGVVREELDLRLEAVLAAEENARLSAGKAPHPFFARKKLSSLKTSVPWEEVSTSQDEDHQPGPPMHITQLSEDERTEVIWPDWRVRCTSGNEDTKLELSKIERKRCRIMRQSVTSIWTELDQRPHFSTNDSELAASQNANAEDGSSDGNETTSSLKALQNLLQHMRILKAVAEAVGELSQSAEVYPGVDADLSLENLKNRFSWYSARHEVLNSAETVTMSQISKESDGEALPSTRNVLWTDLYQPRSSKEVCSNTTAVECLNTWLYKWQIKITGHLIRGEADNKRIEGDRNVDYDYDNDKGWFEDDSDYDSDMGDVGDETGLHNTLLVTGPEGCGKSAAVYACAAEYGFTVIEVNASDCRNGALIKQKFGEAMESHGLGKGSQVGVESPQPASKKGLHMQESSPGQRKQNGTNQRKLFAEKRVGDRSPAKAQQERMMGSQDESQMDSQTKRKTVILFEDVDKHFDEDKGFLTALLQLSKTTKRPIILTSNRYDPGLPPALGQHRVDFGYPTPEELVLHTCLVSIAEGVPCSPWLLERLVDSCHYDLRKVMMTLQFWGQGKPSAFCRPTGLVKIPNQFKNHEFNVDGTSNKVCLEHNKSPNLSRSSKLSLSSKRGKQCFDHWESNARWLFELDVHHFILPKVVCGCFECPLSLLIGEKISTAAKELEEYMEQVASSESEERAREQQATYESMELTRKASKKERDALRRASQFDPMVLDDTGVISLTPDDDVELENHCGENWACSPVKSLREAKTLARSPLKPKILRSRRALLLCDSDDEEQRLKEQPEGSIEAGTQSISNVETPLPGVQNIVNSLDNNVDLVSENLEDVDVIHRSISEVMRTGRRRLSKKGHILGTSVASLNSFCVSTTVDANGWASSLKVGPLDVQRDEIISKSQLVASEVTPRTAAEESDRPILVVDEIDELTELHSSIADVCRTSRSFQIGGQQSTQIVGSCAENQIQSILLSGGEQHLGNASIGIAPEQPAFVDESNDVNKSELVSNHGLQVCCREVLQDTKDGPQESEVIVQPGDLSRGLLGSLPNVSESPEKPVAGVSLSTNSDDHKAAEGSVSPVFDPVNDAWASLRKSQQTSKSLLKHTETGADVASSLADLLDIVSASDVISYVQPEEFKDAWRNFDGDFSEAFEGNIGHSSDWDSCQEIASQLVCTGLQQSLPFLPAVNQVDDRLAVLSCILECAKDAPAVGECMITHLDLTRDHQSNDLYGMVGNMSAKMSPIRQADRQARLEDVVQAVFPRGRVARSSFAEYSAYLSRMSHLEEIRRTSGISQGRRPRRFEHHLTSKFKTLSTNDINELLRYSTFGRS